MKKGRFLSIVAAVVMLIASLGYSTPVYATSRTTTGEVLGAAHTMNDAQVLGARRGSDLGLGISADDITDENVLKTLSDLEIFAQLISTYTGKTVKASELSILDKMDIKLDAGITASKENPVFIPFSFPAILEKSEVYAFHFGKNGWEIVPGTVSDGKIIGEFSELSPVAIVAKTSTLKGGVLGANRSKSARTGDNRMVYILACGLALGMSGLALKKKAI